MLPLISGRHTRIPVWTYCLSLLLAVSARPAFAQIEVDQVSGVQSSSGLLEFGVGKKVTFTVKNTAIECFDYNATSVVTPTTGGVVPTALLALTSKSWTTVHQRGVTAYKVTVTKKTTPDTRCGNPITVADIQLQDREWTVPVATLGWTVGVSAAFTIDKLTDPQFALQSATVNGTEGFNVIEDRGARDDTTQGLAIFLHLSNTAWGSKYSVTWAPVSFGIGFNDNTRYYAGTSVQFGEQFFLTVGKVYGKVARLPNGVAIGDFTTNGNALATLGSRSDDAWYLGFSYQFLSTGLDSKLKGMFSGSGTATPPAE